AEDRHVRRAGREGLDEGDIEAEVRAGEADAVAAEEALRALDVSVADGDAVGRLEEELHERRDAGGEASREEDRQILVRLVVNERPGVQRQAVTAQELEAELADGADAPSNEAAWLAIGDEQAVDGADEGRAEDVAAVDVELRREVEE